jgi:redox-sensitive bicupin YhaK (pirin superfamily)
MTNPRYRGITKTEIPTAKPEPGITIKVITGNIKGNKGPVQDLTVDCEYLDITMKPHTMLEHPTKKDHKAFTYVISGQGSFTQPKTAHIEPEHVALFSQGEKTKITTADNPLRFLLVSGKPIGEPVAWLGPIAMNTQQELETAFSQLNEGTFLKTKPAEKPPELHPTYYKQP